VALALLLVLIKPLLKVSFVLLHSLHLVSQLSQLVRDQSLYTIIIEGIT
jgi:hypothetical protein